MGWTPLQEYQISRPSVHAVVRTPTAPVKMHLVAFCDQYPSSVLVFVGQNLKSKTSISALAQRSGVRYITLSQQLLGSNVVAGCARQSIPDRSWFQHNCHVGYYSDVSLLLVQSYTIWIHPFKPRQRTRLEANLFNSKLGAMF
ncbi:hypothetical protein CCM_03983 [Cordyceps militaris CM01]|uniref:Uncharacterized protein n=2 Tax=Cordyceps militaris TaxID=73501 RepID=G3JDD5_CORMM|nr:uncharacterized protein CCM_03983 [Cordyceps militaris CM01]ATY66862.1 hypothetical protein A9K55_000834 [Cordyceps militaris]EGX92610.1 hypothetical protein CCM_03983 [Cordyceps militaris CM01]